MTELDSMRAKQRPVNPFTPFRSPNHLRRHADLVDVPQADARDAVQDVVSASAASARPSSSRMSMYRWYCVVSTEMVSDLTVRTVLLSRLDQRSTFV